MFSKKKGKSVSFLTTDKKQELMDKIKLNNKINSIPGICVVEEQKNRIGVVLTDQLHQALDTSLQESSMLFIDKVSCEYVNGYINMPVWYFDFTTNKDLIIDRLYKYLSGLIYFCNDVWSIGVDINGLNLS